MFDLYQKCAVEGSLNFIDASGGGLTGAVKAVRLMYSI
jgi:hypothetical protein